MFPDSPLRRAAELRSRDPAKQGDNSRDRESENNSGAGFESQDRNQEDKPPESSSHTAGQPGETLWPFSQFAPSTRQQAQQGDYSDSHRAVCHWLQAASASSVRVGPCILRKSPGPPD